MVFVCWQALSVNDWMMTPATAASTVLPLPSGGDSTAPGPFAFADRDRVVDILHTAQFVDVAAEPTEVPVWVGADPTDAVESFKSTSVGRAMFADAEPAGREAAEHAIEAALAPFVTPDGVVLAGRAWLVSAAR
jgi:hypothetical protein